MLYSCKYRPVTGQLISLLIILVVGSAHGESLTASALPTALRKGGFVIAPSAGRTRNSANRRTCEDQ